MTEPTPIQIPLLVQEKVDFYRWQNKVKMVNQEYLVKIGIMGEETDIVLYRINDILGAGIGLVCHIDIYRSNIDKKIVRNFINPTGKGYILPTKYKFSSGLDHKGGYKLSYEQQAEMYIKMYENNKGGEKLLVYHNI